MMRESTGVEKIRKLYLHVSDVLDGTPFSSERVLCPEGEYIVRNVARNF